MSVIIQSAAGIPPLDENTVLFLKDKVVLGKVMSFIAVYTPHITT